MPLYDYQCMDCGHAFEEFSKVDDRLKMEKNPCPKCSNKSLKLIIGVPNISAGSMTGGKKLPSWYKDVERNIKKCHPQSNMKTHY